MRRPPAIRLRPWTVTLVILAALAFWSLRTAAVILGFVLVWRITVAAVSGRLRSRAPPGLDFTP